MDPSPGSSQPVRSTSGVGLVLQTPAGSALKPRPPQPGVSGVWLAPSRLVSRLRCFEASQELRLRRVRQVEVTAAALTELDVLAAHEHSDLADGNMHVAAGANLVAHHRHPFLAPDAETFVVANDGLGYLAAQFGCLGFRLFVQRRRPKSSAWSFIRSCNTLFIREGRGLTA